MSQLHRLISGPQTSLSCLTLLLSYCGFCSANRLFTRGMMFVNLLISTFLFFFSLCSSSESSDVFGCCLPLLAGYSQKLHTSDFFFLEVFYVKLNIKQLVSPSNWCLLSVASHTHQYFLQSNEELLILPWGVTSLLFTLRHTHVTHLQFSGKKKKRNQKKAHWINKVSSSINISPPGLQNVWLWDKKQLSVLSTAFTGSKRCGSSALEMFCLLRGWFPVPALPRHHQPRWWQAQKCNF